VIGVFGIAKTGLIFPYFFCNASPGAVCVCPLWVLEHGSILFAIDLKQALTMLLFLFGFLGLIGFVIGRTFCGWACPIGFIQDIAKPFRGKIKISDFLIFGIFISGWVMVLLTLLYPSLITGYIGITGVAIVAIALFGLLTKIDNVLVSFSEILLTTFLLIFIWFFLESESGIREVWIFISLMLIFVAILSVIHKYVILKQKLIRDSKFYHKNQYFKLKYIILILIPITSYVFLDKWFTNIDPIGGLTAGVPVLMYEYEKWKVSDLLWIKFILIGLFFWMIFITYRGFCRFFCPVGAMMAPTNKISLQDIKYYPENCVKCNKCL
jgi:polyferredoxin